MPVAKLQKLLADLDGLMLMGQESLAPYDSSETQDLIENAPSKAEDDPFTQCLRGEIHGQLAKSIAELSRNASSCFCHSIIAQDLTMWEAAR